MFIRIISDCRDDNARGRVETRIATLLDCTPGFTGVGSDLEAAGNLVDILAAGLGRSGIIIVNVAPRDGKRENGSPFGVFRWKNTTVLTTIDGMTLSLVRALGMLQTLYTIDFDATLLCIAKRFELSNDERDSIRNSQFRGLEFQPFCAVLLAEGEQLPAKPESLSTIPKMPEHTVWLVDNFGNVKMSTVCDDDALPPKDAQVALYKDATNYPMRFYLHLKDVPMGMAALTQGSSGVGCKKFFQIVIKGGNAAKHFGIASGDTLLLELPSKQGVPVNV